MNTNILKFAAVIVFSFHLQGQVGVNTKFPLGPLHVDGNSDNTSASPTAAQLDNDLITNASGQVGIGNTPDATAKLSLNTTSARVGQAFRLADGTQGQGYLLTSSASGDVTWKKRIVPVGLAGSGGFNGPVTSDMQSTNNYFDLDPGRWIIFSNILLCTSGATTSTTSGLFAQLSWGEQNADGVTYSLTGDAVSGNTFGGNYNTVYSIAIGRTIINNTSTGKKRYYLLTRKPIFWGTYYQDKNWANLAGPQWGETALIAYPAN